MTSRYKIQEYFLMFLTDYSIPSATQLNLHSNGLNSATQ